MLLQYIRYKNAEFDRAISDCEASEREAIQARKLEFLRTYLVDEHPGKIVVTKGMTEEMLTLARENKIPLVLDRSDWYIELGVDMPNFTGETFRSLEDIVAIHKTMFPPKKDTIFTPESSGLENYINFMDPATDISHVVPYVVGNDAIHFTLNCPVENSNHRAGNDWDSYKYAVMLGFAKLDKSRVEDAKSEDTSISGDVELGDDYYLFCPFGERESVQKANPKATVIEYDGIPLNIAITRVILYSGKKLEPYGTYGWQRHGEYDVANGDNRVLNQLLDEAGYPRLQGDFGDALYSETVHAARGMWKREYRALIALLEYNSEIGIDMPDEVAIYLLKMGGAYQIPGNVPVSVSAYKQCVLPLLAEHGYDVPETFFEGIDPNAEGKKYIILQPAEVNGYPIDMPVVSCPEWEIELRNRVVSLVKDSQKASGVVEKNAHI